MAYAPFVNGKPVWSDNGADVIDDTRENLEAMRDAVVADVMPGWSWEKSNGSGTDEQPQYELMKYGVNWIRITLAWGSSGGAAGNIVSEIFEFSNNSGAAYVAMGSAANPTHNKLSHSFDTGGNPTTSTWGAP